MILKPMALIGFAGSGKTAAGAFAARELGLPFMDITECLPDVREGTDMSGFNQLMTLLLSKAAAVGGIVASDESDVMMPKNRKMLKENFVTVLLDAPFDVLYDRISKSGKIMAYNYHRSELCRIYEMRQKQYRECADFVVDCARPLEDVASDIAEIALSEGCADINSIVI